MNQNRTIFRSINFALFVHLLVIGSLWSLEVSKMEFILLEVFNSVVTLGAIGIVCEVSDIWRKQKKAKEPLTNIELQKAGTF